MSTASGSLFLFDFGLVRLWSNDSPPFLAPDTVPHRIAEIANSAIDFEIVGPDAAELSAALDLASGSGNYIFDLPNAAFLEERVREITDTRHLHAEARPVDRIPHMARVRMLLDKHPEGATIPYHGMWGIAFGGLRTGLEFAVKAQRMPSRSDFSDRWESVWVELSNAAPTHSVLVGHVLVDEARLMFVDPQALGAWRSDESLDGQADVAFWGRDATSIAHQLDAGVIDQGQSPVYGWLNLPIDQAVEHSRHLDDLKRDPAVKFAIDFRPHDDHHRLLTVARTTRTESASIELAGTKLTGFFTTWGDGAFPVFRDSGADGSICRIRVEFASE